MPDLANNEPDIDHMYLYSTDLYVAKYQLVVNKRESKGLKYSNNLKAFIKYSDDMDYIIQVKTKKYWLCLMIKKLNISLVFITQCYFSVSKKN